MKKGNWKMENSFIIPYVEIKKQKTFEVWHCIGQGP